ncbi:MAG: carboxypeptidase regulatory-like domain-containing protein [Flavobacteriales bacterium]|nr:carboxypeptidase regulatory-like domain-containing protein [Flavobacteriales bacterium]
MKKIVFYISVLLFVVISNDVYAQNYTITGRVVDLDGNPVNGAVVRANKSKIEAKTSADGEYVIKLSPDDRKLRVYYNDVLHKWQRVSVKDTTEGVTLKINTAPVVEMVKGDTYYPSIDDNTFSRMIDGRFPGCYTSGNYVVIRGQMCMYYMVDGVRVPSLEAANPYDVYSITIIRNMADCVIYGRDARNGVVIIKLKDGNNNAPREGSGKKAKVFINSSMGASF